MLACMHAMTADMLEVTSPQGWAHKLTECEIRLEVLGSPPGVWPSLHLVLV